jgi:hypothetical protein
MFALTFSKNAKPMTARRRVVAHTHDEFLALDLILPNWLRLLKTSWRKNDKEIDDDGLGTDGQEFLEDTIAKGSDCNNKNAMSVSRGMILMLMMVSVVPMVAVIILLLLVILRVQ